MQKQTKLRELVGDVRTEEEPAGEDVVGPNGEMMDSSSGEALSFLPLSSSLPFFFLFFQNLVITMIMSS